MRVCVYVIRTNETLNASENKRRLSQRRLLAFFSSSSSSELRMTQLRLSTTASLASRLMRSSSRVVIGPEGGESGRELDLEFRFDGTSGE